MSQQAAMTNRSTKKTPAAVLRECSPFDDGQSIHGVTFDGERVWFARENEVVAFDPARGEVVRRFDVPGAAAGTSFDGKHLYQLAGARILVLDPADGRIVREMPAPGAGDGSDSGMAYADGYLWIGQYRGRAIVQVDAKTGRVVKRLASDRFVTGVSVVDGAVWHGAAGDEQPSELRRLAPDGTVAEAVALPEGAFVSGVESNGKDAFWCGGERGKLRLVGRKAS